MANKYKYDYYIVELPGDLFYKDDEKDLMEQFQYAAIDQAYERAKLYCVPADWSAVLISGEFGDNTLTFKVSRRRNNIIKDKV